MAPQSIAPSWPTQPWTPHAAQERSTVEHSTPFFARDAMRAAEMLADLRCSYRGQAIRVTVADWRRALATCQHYANQAQRAIDRGQRQLAGAQRAIQTRK